MVFDDSADCLLRTSGTAVHVLVVPYELQNGSIWILETDDVCDSATAA